MRDHDRARRKVSGDDRETGHIGPLDPDLALIEKWLARDLSEVEARAVEERFVHDEAFFEKVAPIIKIWTMPVSFRALLERPDPALRQRPALRVEPAQRRAGSRLSRWRRRHPRFWTTLPTGALTVYSVASLLALVVSASTIAYVRYADRPRDPVTRDQDRAPATQVPNGVTVATGPGETKTIHLRGGSRVVVRHDSRFTYAYVASTRSMMAALDGEAAIDLTSEQPYMLVKTSSGRALLTPGSYAVRCEPGCAAMQVTVGAGLASIRADTGRSGLSLNAGDRGRVPKRGSPEKVIPGDGWPTVEPPRPPPPAPAPPSATPAPSAPRAPQARAR